MSCIGLGFSFLFSLLLHQVGEVEEGHPSWHRNGGSAKNTKRRDAEKTGPKVPETPPPGTGLYSHLFLYFIHHVVLFSEYCFALYNLFSVLSAFR